MSANALSFLGRMGYWTHMAFYPSCFMTWKFVVSPWLAARDKAAAKKEWDELIAAKPVDPDLFNPFTPIPYHNNPELTYAFAHIKMKNYVNENGINVNDYLWAGYHDSYDHNNAKQYRYNFTKIM